MSDSQQKELTKEEQQEITNVKILQAYKMNMELAERLSMGMSARQLGRVLRALLKSPLEEPGKLVDVKERALFEAGMAITDAKILLVMDQQSSIEKALEETRQKAVELESNKEEGDKSNG
jgi:hypothetical protein